MKTQELIAYIFSGLLIMGYIILIIYLSINYSYWWLLLFLLTPRMEHNNE